MGSYAFVYVNEVEVASFRNGVDPTFMLLFTRNDLRLVRRSGMERPASGYGANEHYEAVDFVATCRAIRERLDALSIGSAQVSRTFQEIRSLKLASMQVPCSAM
jgi:hypothetical protein